MPAPSARSGPYAARVALARWFSGHVTRYPWRIDPDPYRVLVSEVMLQQTQAGRVGPAFDRFMARFPDIRSLAAADRDDVIRAWTGLGYNRRAVALHRTAQIVVRDHGGRVPRDPDRLVTLPGVGPYTAAAVAAIGYGVPVAALDTNVRRVVARAVLGRDASEVDPGTIAGAAVGWLDPSRPGNWNQAVMDLGRDVCRSTPRCARCPLEPVCRFAGRGKPPRPASRPHPPFEGSSRQLRGALIEALRSVPSATLASIARSLGASLESLGAAVRSLFHDGLVDAGPAALEGRPGGRVRLARGN
jgi:A/G-specific adenine glycosylase